jgi:tetratricopeptide (TPR) repeat protein
LADANEAVKREAGTIWALYRRGMIYRYRSEYDRALADFDLVLRRYPYDASSYVERGRIYEKKGDLVRARADFERALKERGTQFKKAHADARAQLASLDAGAASPAPKAAPAALLSPAAAVPQAPVVAKDQGRRVALVIGNGNYVHTPKLANPTRDAQAVARSLRAIGFQSVTVASDQSRESLIGALRSFAREAEKADWAMVYYAGHGIEVGGVNYLIPVDAKLETDRDAALETVSLEQVLSAVDGARKIKLVVLDACRDNPFAAQMRRTVATRSIGRGLGRIEPEGATLVVYAAKHGQTALDGDGANSPFASALVRRMATPDIEINKIFRLIRDDVMDATAGRQEPFTYGSLPGREDFYFVSAK